MGLFTELFKSGILFFIDVLCIAILVRALISVFTGGESSSGAYRFCCAVTEPFVAPSRKLLDKLGMGVEGIGMDLSNFLTGFILLLIVDLLHIFVP